MRMAHPLKPDTALVVRLTATCARNKYATDPGPVLQELQEIAGGRADLLAEAAGLWSGFQRDEDYTRVLADALRALPGTEEWVELGRRRRDAPTPGTP